MSYQDAIVNEMNVYDKIYNFKNLTKRQGLDVVNFLLNSTLAPYRVNWYFRDLIVNEHLGDDHKLKLFRKYISNNNGTYADADNIFESVIKVDKDKVIEIIKSTKETSFARRLLTLNPSIDDEVAGLRALSKSKYCPTYIYTGKYMPTIGALKKIPSIMRLKALEALTSNLHASYNIFGKITDSDEFKKLMFGSVTKYNARVQSVWEKYVELQMSGTPGVVALNFTCNNCSDYEIVIKSNVVRTVTKFASSRLSKLYNSGSCALCGKWGTIKNKSVSIDNTLVSKDEQDE